MNENPWGSSQQLISVGCVCVTEIFTFLVSLSNPSTLQTESTSQTLQLLWEQWCICVPEFSLMWHSESGCVRLRQGTFLKKPSQVSHEAQKHHCALFFWITKVENQFSFSLSIKKYVCPSAAGFNLIIIITIIMMAIVMIRWGSANTISLICVCCDADEARSVWMQVEAAGRNKPFQNQISS